MERGLGFPVMGHARAQSTALQQALRRPQAAGGEAHALILGYLSPACTCCWDLCLLLLLDNHFFFAYVFCLFLHTLGKLVICLFPT